MIRLLKIILFLGSFSLFARPSDVNTVIPTEIIGPVQIKGDVVDTIEVPLSTYERPLWPSTGRGAKVSRLSGGIQVTVLSENMTRSVLVEAKDAAAAHVYAKKLKAESEKISNIVASTSRYARLKDFQVRVVGNLLFIRMAIHPGDAAGHNMVTKASDAVLRWLVTTYSDLEYVSVSGNYCTDKKVSAVNSVLGRGKHVIAEIKIPRQTCKDVLHTTPEKIVQLNIKKNLVGSIASGGLCSANAHYANILLAFYLATGQDAANIVEGSQGITYAEVKDGDLYFSVTLPNIIVGTVGNGKNAPFVQENMNLMKCSRTDSRRLACIAAATVLCGEVSLMAALTNQGELMKAHVALERGRE